MKKDKRIKIEVNEKQLDLNEQLDVANLSITNFKISKDDKEVQIPLAELTQVQEIPFLVRHSFKQLKPNKPLNFGLVAVPEKQYNIKHAQRCSKPFLTGGVLVFVVISSIVFFDKFLPSIIYFYRRKNKNRILELKVSCPFSLCDTIMSAISKDDVCAGEVGSVIGIKYKPGP